MPRIQPLRRRRRANVIWTVVVTVVALSPLAFWVRRARRVWCRVERTVERVCRYGEMSSPVRSTRSAWTRRPRSKSASEHRPPTHRRARWPDWFDPFADRFRAYCEPIFYAARLSVSPRVTLFSLPKPMKPGFAVRLARFRSNPSAEAAASNGAWQRSLPERSSGGVCLAGAATQRLA